MVDVPGDLVALARQILCCIPVGGDPAGVRSSCWWLTLEPCKSCATGIIAGNQDWALLPRCRSPTKGISRNPLVGRGIAFGSAKAGMRGSGWSRMVCCSGERCQWRVDQPRCGNPSLITTEGSEHQGPGEPVSGYFSRDLICREATSM